MNQTQYYKSRSEALEQILNHHQLWLHRDMMEFLSTDRVNKNKMEEAERSSQQGQLVISKQAD